MPGLIAIVVISAIAGGSWLGYRWLTTSDRFAVTEIELRGNDRLTDSEVLELSGVELGDNLFRIDPSRVARDIERDPWIEGAVAKRRLPDSLVIEVVERRATIVVELDGLYLADSDGHIFKRATIRDGEGMNLPVLTGLDRANYQEDQATAEAAIRSALATAALYGQVDDRPTIGEIHLDPRRGITLHTYDTGLAIRLGRAPDTVLAERMRAFDAAWRSLDPSEKAAAHIIYADNATHPDRVTVGFRRGRPEPSEMN